MPDPPSSLIFAVNAADFVFVCIKGCGSSSIKSPTLSSFDRDGADTGNMHFRLFSWREFTATGILSLTVSSLLRSVSSPSSNDSPLSVSLTFVGANVVSPKLMS